MDSPSVPKSAVIDELDRQIVRALQLAPRAPFARIAGVLDVAEQTVARRYRALHRSGVLRVIAVVDPTALGESDWVLRIRSRPEATMDLGRALAQRRDVGWVSVAAGGSELVCAVRSPSQEQRERLLADRLPRSAAVLDVAAGAVLRRFAGSSTADWLGVRDVLTPQQRDLLTAGEPPARASVGAAASGAPPGGADHAMLDVLHADGRAPIGRLARAAGISPGRAARRLDALLRAGTVYLDVDLAGARLGFPTSAYLWLTVPPGRLAAVGEALSTHPEAVFVAAVTGRANVLAGVICRGLDELYRYLTESVGAIDGIAAAELSLVQRRVKQAGTLMDGDRLAVQ